MISFPRGRFTNSHVFFFLDHLNIFFHFLDPYFLLWRFFKASRSSMVKLQVSYMSSKDLNHIVVYFGDNSSCSLCFGGGEWDSPESSSLAFSWGSWVCIRMFFYTFSSSQFQITFSSTSTSRLIMIFLVFNCIHDNP